MNMFEVDYEKIKITAEIGKTNEKVNVKVEPTWKTTTVPKTFSISGTEFGDRKTVTIYPGGRIVVNKGGY